MNEKSRRQKRQPTKRTPPSPPTELKEAPSKEEKSVSGLVQSFISTLHNQAAKTDHPNAPRARRRQFTHKGD